MSALTTNAKGTVEVGSVKDGSEVTRLYVTKQSQPNTAASADWDKKAVCNPCFWFKETSSPEEANLIQKSVKVDDSLTVSYFTNKVAVKKLAPLMILKETEKKQHHAGC